MPGARSLGAVSLFVKRLEELVRFVDELLDAAARLVRLRAPLKDQQTHDRDREADRQSGGADPEQGAQVFLTRFRQLVTPSMVGHRYLVPVWVSFR